MIQTLTAWDHYQISADTRTQDAAIRKQTPGTAIINLNTLMTDMAADALILFRTRAETRAYLQAIHDIHWMARNSVQEHSLLTGELYAAPGIINGTTTALIDQLLEQHQ